jgi:hypothetical protein
MSEDNEMVEHVVIMTDMKDLFNFSGGKIQVEKLIGKFSVDDRTVQNLS